MALKRPVREEPEDAPEESGAEIEFGGMTFKGGKMFALLTALSTLGGAAWGGFEFYNDYRNMKEIVENIDVSEIRAENRLMIEKLDGNLKQVDKAIDYATSIKTDLRDQIMTLDGDVRRVEKTMRENDQVIREVIQNAEERFENKRDSLQNDYDQKANSLRDRTDQKIQDVETRLTEKLQRALDNPLAN